MMMATQVQVRSVCRSLNACRFAVNASAATFNRDYSYGVHTHAHSVGYVRRAAILART